MINIFCVLTKPKYNYGDVYALYASLHKHIPVPFKFNILTDQPIGPSADPLIQFIDVREYQLDTWWNKVLAFSNQYSGDHINMLFDLDIEIRSDLQFLIDSAVDDKIAVVDTFWKNNKYFKQNVRRPSAFIAYGNTSVVVWKGKQHHYLVEMLLEDPFKHTSEHFGDDTYIQQHGSITYLPRRIAHFLGQHQVKDPAIVITVKRLGANVDILNHVIPQMFVVNDIAER